MASSKKKWGFVVVGAVAAVALGAIGVAGAASNQQASPSPSSSAQVDGQHAPDFDGDGPHGGFDGGGLGLGRGGGGPDMAEALAKLSGKDVSAIMEQRAAGKSFKQIAEAEGIDTARLVADAVAIEKAELDAAVKAGTLTDAQRTEIEAGLQDRFQQELTETGMPGGHGGPGGPGGGHGRGLGGGAPDIAEALAELSGKDASDILAQHESGKTFAQIAKAAGVATDELLAKATAIEKAELDAAVKAGTLTDAQRAEIVSGLQAHLKEELTEVHSAGDGHGSGRDGDGRQAPSVSSSPSTGGASLSY